MAASSAASFVVTAACFAPLRAVKVVSKLTPQAKFIGTHNGTFHCDEALAVSMLKLLPRFASHDVVRTRDESVLQGCEVVVDVGGVFDAEKLRFDHHQKSFQGTFDGFKTRLSSAGLVYKHFGRELIQILAEKPLDAETLDLLYTKTYKNFVEHIDGIDNGIEAAQGPANYQVSTTLSNRVGYLNPQWNEDDSPDRINERFQQAMLLAITEFTDSVQSLVHCWLPARSLVEDGVQKRFQVHASGEILHFPQYCPWKSHLYDVEKQFLIDGRIKFVIYHDQSDMCRVQCVNVEGTSFTLRQGLLEKWRGLRDETLSQVSGIDGCTFVHVGGFIGGNKTYEGALAMAVASLPPSTSAKTQ